MVTVFERRIVCVCFCRIYTRFPVNSCEFEVPCSRSSQEEEAYRF